MKKEIDEEKLLRLKAGYFQHTSPHKTKGFEKVNSALLSAKRKRAKAKRYASFKLA